VVRSVAIIGGGPSGLAAAKAALESGMRPTVFERTEEIGGLWRPGSGCAWPGMATNLSRYSCCFSDFPWPDDAPDFPRQPEVFHYLHRYADTFDLHPYLRLRCPISRGDQVARFDAVIVASGIFATPVVPALPGSFGGLSGHSSNYRGPEEFLKRRVAVVGMAFSGAEIAAELASAGVPVTAVVSHPLWTLPRYRAHADGALLPWELVAYTRSAQHARSLLTPAEANRTLNHSYHELGANPGLLDPRLWLDPHSPDPPHVVISDRLPGLIRSGQVTVEPGRALRLERDHLVLDTGTEVSCDAIIWCTGYRPDLPLLSGSELAALAFDPHDLLQPLLLHKCTFHPDLPGMAFIGLYRGPFFGVIELQARWSCAVLSGQLAPSTQEQLRAGLEHELAIRRLWPRPQFPHGDYVGLADSIASDLGVLPDIEALWDQPVIPAHYRLRGPGSKPELARREITSLLRRIRSS
jgi:cation diffusion facilitator CzcD-associated flavoprotein CzcO